MKKTRNQWHPGFYAAVQLEFKDDKKALFFEQEHGLSKKPLQLDLLIVKKEGLPKTKNKIGHIFQKYNIMEYKSPDDALGIDAYYKTIAYACLYKDESCHENEYQAKDITISLIRNRYPQKLIQYLLKEGCEIREQYPGIYYVEGRILFKTQIVVTSRVSKWEHRWLTALTKHITQDDYAKLKIDVSHLIEKDDQSNADALLQVVSKANEDELKKWKEDSAMCAIIEEIFAPELEEAKEKGATEALRASKLVAQGIKTVEGLVEQGISPTVAELVLSEI